MENDISDLLKEFTDEQVAKLDEIIARFKGKPGGLIPTLEEARWPWSTSPFQSRKGSRTGLICRWPKSTAL